MRAPEIALRRGLDLDRAGREIEGRKRLTRPDERHFHDIQEGDVDELPQPDVAELVGDDVTITFLYAMQRSQLGERDVPIPLCPGMNRRG